MTLLVDPLLLTPPGRPGAPLSSAPEFWSRLIDWSRDRRTRLGAECLALVCAEYGEHGYPDQDLELDIPTLRREYQAALGKLLSKVLMHTSGSAERTFTPTYLGSDERSIALQLDVSGTVNAGVLGVATAADHWADGMATAIAIAPPPPQSLSLAFMPGEELPAERAEQVRSFYQQKRVHIVGGRKNEAIAEAIITTLGIQPDALNWIECEKARPPRNLDDRWRRLAPGRDVTVCITGRVGHATSAKAKLAATRAGVVHLMVELPTEVKQALVDYSVSSSV